MAKDINSHSVQSDRTELNSLGRLCKMILNKMNETDNLSELR